MIVCVVFSSHLFWTSSSLDVPIGVTKDEGHTGFLIHLSSGCVPYNISSSTVNWVGNGCLFSNYRVGVSIILGVVFYNLIQSNLY